MTVQIRLLQEDELQEADRIFKLAFRTFAKAGSPSKYPDDMTFMKRWYTDPQAAFAAEVDGQLVGSNFAINWGSFGLFGPLTVHPDFWGRKIAQKLIEPALDCFNQWNISQTGFFTRYDSPLHLKLYQKFGFHPRYLTCLMSKSPKISAVASGAMLYSQLSCDQQTECLNSAFELTNTLYEELDLRTEIETINNQSLGDTIFLWDDKGLVSFALCHYGKDTEAGSGNCYIKFGAVRKDYSASEHFEQLLQACEDFAVNIGASCLMAGMSTAREEAYHKILANGYRIDRLGVAMHSPNKPAFNCPGLYIIDDWR